MTELLRVNHANWRKCVRVDPEIRLTTLAVAMVISEYGHYETGTAVRPSMETVAREVGLANPKKLYPHLKKIKDGGYLRDTGDRHAKGVVVYELWAPADMVSMAGATALRTATEKAPDTRKPAKPYKAAQKPVRRVPAAVPAVVAKPEAVELNLDQRLFFLEGRPAEEWEWSGVSYVEAEQAYRVSVA